MALYYEKYYMVYGLGHSALWITPIFEVIYYVVT